MPRGARVSPVNGNLRGKMFSPDYVHRQDLYGKHLKVNCIRVRSVANPAFALLRAQNHPCAGMSWRVHFGVYSVFDVGARFLSGERWLRKGLPYGPMSPTTSSRALVQTPGAGLEN